MNRITLPVIPPSMPTALPKGDGKKAVARLTVRREIGDTIIVEVHEDATFHAFYRFHTQSGTRRSTKRLVRTASRNEGLRPYYAAYRMQPGLEVLAENWKKQPGIKSVTVRIIRKRIYKQLINAAADALGLTKVHAGFKAERPQGYSVRLPQGYTPLEKRFEILASK
jgi:hypothetical protein